MLSHGKRQKSLRAEVVEKVRFEAEVRCLGIPNTVNSKWLPAQI